jgi:hypothetical protein
MIRRVKQLMKKGFAQFIWQNLNDVKLSLSRKYYGKLASLIMSEPAE